MGRDQILPAWFNKVHPKFLTPYRSVIISGAIAILLALSDQAEALAEISATLYMITYALLAVSVIIMRRGGSQDYQPAFKVPLYPILTVLGGLLPLLVIVTMDTLSQIAALILIGVSVGWYYVWGRRKSDVEGALAPWVEREHPLEVLIEEAEDATRTSQHEILVPVSDPDTAHDLLNLAVQLAKGDPEGQILAVNLVQVPQTLSLEMAKSHLDQLEKRRNEETLKAAETFFEEATVPGVVHQQPVYDIASGISGLVELRPATRLVLLEWHGRLKPSLIRQDVAKKVVRSAPCDVGVFLDRGLETARKILIPEGGGPHARMGLRLAKNLLADDEGEIILLRVISPSAEDEEEQKEALEHLIQEELDEIPEDVHPKILREDSIVNGVLTEAKGGYDLVVVGASEQWGLENLLFGNKPDRIADHAPCSVLMLRKWEPRPIPRLRRWLEDLRNQE